jgi:hypothetical protein
VKCGRFDRWTFFPDGKMPPSTAGKDACRHIFRQALTSVFRGDPILAGNLVCHRPAGIALRLI